MRNYNSNYYVMDHGYATMGYIDVRTAKFFVVFIVFDVVVMSNGKPCHPEGHVQK